MAAGALILAALAALFWKLYWSRDVAGEYFVPDSAPHSILFFLAVFGGMLGRPDGLDAQPREMKAKMVSPAGFEPATY